MIAITNSVKSVYAWIDRLVDLPAETFKRDRIVCRAVAIWPILSIPLGGALIISQFTEDVPFELQFAQIACLLAALFAVPLLIWTKRPRFSGLWFVTFASLSLVLQPMLSFNYISGNLILLSAMPVLYHSIVSWKNALKLSIALLAVFGCLIVQALSTGASDQELVFLASCFAATFGILTTMAGFAQSVSWANAQLKIRQNELLETVSTDPLTGCFNRRAFDDRTRHNVNRDCKADFLLCLIDLDNFKQINDLHGHGVGDDILTALVSRIQDLDLVRTELYRIGGDEFAILASADVWTPESLSAKIASVTQTLFQTRSGMIELCLSIGCVIGNLDEEEFEPIYRRADVALFEAKRDDTTCWQVFNSELAQQNERILNIERRLVASAAENGFDYAVQPQVGTWSRETVGFEVLVRWSDAELGPVSPNEFIPIAERIRLVGAIDRCVFQTALLHAQTWLTPDQTIAFNVSPRTLAAPDYIAFVERVLNSTQIDPRQVEFEITETSLIQNWDTTMRRLEELKALGVRLALDDFGTGYSSLNYLSRLPIDKLKIDRSFIERCSDPVNRLILGAVIKLARDMKLDLVAEGIENTSHLAFAMTLKCPILQGYFFAKPIASHQIAEETKRLKHG